MKGPKSLWPKKDIVVRHEDCGGECLQVYEEGSKWRK